SLFLLRRAGVAGTIPLPLFFFFHAEDGIRDRNVTGVQTCALPILLIRQVGRADVAAVDVVQGMFPDKQQDFVLNINETDIAVVKIGRASCRERVERAGGGGAGQKKKKERRRRGTPRGERSEGDGVR